MINPICPYCKKQIDGLDYVCVCNEYGSVELERSTDENSQMIGNENEHDAYDDYNFNCPECGEKIEDLTSWEKAEKFLQGKIIITEVNKEVESMEDKYAEQIARHIKTKLTKKL
ncbi:MAG: hypothetical protein WC679_14090 [Bacteroidales bacterium]|jgi:transcription initiation factor IIE alpha subunit